MFLNLNEVTGIIKLNDERDMKFVLKQFADPVRMMIIIKILRKPGITSNELKKELLIPGTKIYYYLNQLSNSKPPVVYESDTERVTEHLIRRKFKITDDLKDILNNYFDRKRNPIQFRVYALHMSIAIQYQQIRELGTSSDKDTKEHLPSPILMFVDDEIAQELREGIAKTFAKCLSKYRDMDRFDAIQVCNFGAIAGIYPMN